MASHILFLVTLLALASSHATASDPSALQDFCVADTNSKVFVNGFVCKDPKLAQASDFFFTLKPGNTAAPPGAAVTPAFVTQIPGLNTLGVSAARLDFALNGLLGPHYHPRATELLTVIEGTLYVGFVTASPNNILISKVLNKGDVFAFPPGLPHFQFNSGETNVVAISAFSSQNPGLVFLANAAFGSNPPISDDILEKSFKLDKKTIDLLKATFKP